MYSALCMLLLATLMQFHGVRLSPVAPPDPPVEYEWVTSGKCPGVTQDICREWAERDGKKFYVHDLEYIAPLVVGGCYKSMWYNIDSYFFNPFIKKGRECNKYMQCLCPVAAPPPPPASAPQRPPPGGAPPDIAPTDVAPPAQVVAHGPAMAPQRPAAPPPPPEPPVIISCTKTSGGNAEQGACCHFPFEYEGNLYDKCINMDKGGKPWCGTDETAETWGFCVGEPVLECRTKADIGFLLDSSGSLGSFYGKEKLFMTRLTEAFKISESGTRASVITFSHKAQLSIKLNDHFNIKSFQSAVAAIPHMNSITRIDLAMQLAMKEMFKSENGARVSAPKVLILLTDGVQSVTRGSSDPVEMANQVRGEGIQLLAVGMGTGADINELRAIAASDDKAFKAKNFKELLTPEFINTLTQKNCEVVGVVGS